MDNQRIFNFYLSNIDHRNLKRIAFYSGHSISSLLREGAKIIAKRYANKINSSNERKGRLWYTVYLFIIKIVLRKLLQIFIFYYLNINRYGEDLNEGQVYNNTNITTKSTW